MGEIPGVGNRDSGVGAFSTVFIPDAIASPLDKLSPKTEGGDDVGRGLRPHIFPDSRLPGATGGGE